MGMVTTHREGLVVTHSDDDRRSTEVVLLPGRDAATAAEQPVEAAKPPVTPAKPSPAVKTAEKQMRTRTKKAAPKAGKKRR